MYTDEIVEVELLHMIYLHSLLLYLPRALGGHSLPHTTLKKYISDKNPNILRSIVETVQGQK